MTILLVTNDEGWHARVSDLLPHDSIFTAKEESEALRHLRRVTIDIAIWLGRDHSNVDDFIARAREVAPSCVTIAVTTNLDAGANFVIPLAAVHEQFQSVLANALEQRRLLEIASPQHRQTLGSARVEATAPPPPPDRVLKEFTRILAAGFDLPRTLDMFLDGVVELVR
ncbi:MAG: hypothetical protein FJ027_06685, partial [Candidatus Rokubacteria bacterium]|nr:hypothetical protein [Candidatus Rokubacteria bacterium]